MKLGVDIDGVLANFTDSYSALLCRATGMRLPLASSEWPTLWYWDRDAMQTAGVLEADAKRIEKDLWSQITARGSSFWYDLDALAGAVEVLSYLDRRRRQGHDVYFITTRPGHAAKRQTEDWLDDYGMTKPTVLVAANEAAKGQMAAALGLDFYIDDKPSNCEAVRDATMKYNMVVIDGAPAAYAPPSYPCRVCLLDWAYNRDFNAPGIERVYDVLGALRSAVEENYGRNNRLAA